MTEYIFPPNLALKALQSGPYRNEAYAIAELIDNSADAKATSIAVALIVDDGSRPTEIAVLDNGNGMDRELLRRCVQYGYGTAEDESEGETRKGKRRRASRLGKFGVGLVASSFSQCTDLQVMSWQNGETAAGKALATRLRLSDEASVLGNVLPDPADEEIPEWATAAFEGMPEPISTMESGTLVVWRDVSTTYRRRAITLQKNIRELCGRIHREFIRSGRLSIIVNVFDKASGAMVGPTMLAPPVDPTFLTNWNVDALADDGFTGDETLFTPYTGHPGDEGKDMDGEYEPHWGEVRGPDEKSVIGNYMLTASYRRRRVVDDQKLSKKYRDPGQADFGKLANQLRGVSLMRSEREIALDPAWLRGDRTVDRWVSVSIDFDPDLDDVFGVSNDKQQVRGLAELASIPIKEIKERLDVLRSEGDPAEDWKDIRCLEVAHAIKDRLRRMQKIVSDQRGGARQGGKGAEAPDDPYTPPVEELMQDGNALSDRGREIPMDSTNPSSDPEGTTAAYGDTLAGGEPARDVRPRLVMENELKLDYSLDPHGQPTIMFSIGHGPGHLIVKFHEQHPLSEAMARLLVPEEVDEDEGGPPELGDALRIIRGLVASFARSLAEANALNPHEALALNQSLGLWSASAAHILESESD